MLLLILSSLFLVATVVRTFLLEFFVSKALCLDHEVNVVSNLCDFNSRADDNSEPKINATVALYFKTVKLNH